MDAPLISFYFQVHQPYRLRDLRITEIGREGMTYFDEEKNRAVFRKVAEKCYLPANRLMLELLNRHENFAISYSLSGVFLEQCEEYGADVLDSFRALARTGKVEFLAETYYHSLSALSSIEEFCEQVEKHVAKIETLFDQRPTIFRNTELVFSNEIAETVRLLGFQGILAEGADHLLYGRTPNQPYTIPKFDLPEDRKAIIQKHKIHRKPVNEISVLLKNYRLSDDVAFRFSDRSWVGFPLHADTFTNWLTASGGHSVNLYMDYETFGEHQWEDTGIFEFLRALPAMWAAWNIGTATPSAVIKAWGKRPKDIFDAHAHVSWADIERDLSAWRGNRIQEAAFAGIYGLEDAVKNAHDEGLLTMWRKLQTSDHFYYMCTKYWSDGDVHKYFSPYESPYEAYRRYSHALCDLKAKLEKIQTLETMKVQK
ncbi:MAG TPA: glycoside hydrolase family 57 protein [Candidatus Peribacterales bacterium]|nr:glycoside hydrolase family 57 protein [Candidatus Peribacterales bacterium]